MTANTASFVAVQVSSSIRGLDIRCKWARAEVAAVIGNAELANDLGIDANDDAVDLGLRDAQNGVKDPPMMIKGTVLAPAWAYGVGRFWEMEEMRRCPDCQSDPFTPCPWHG